MRQFLITGTVYTVLGVIWVVYGVRHREWPLIIGNSAGLNGVVVLGILRDAGITF